MRTPSTGSAEPPKGRNDRPTDDDADASKAQPTDGAQTHTTSFGRPAPRLPHERDESSDSGTGGPSTMGHRAHDDAISDKEATDRGEASDAIYRDTLRGKTPGAERDAPADDQA